MNGAVADSVLATFIPHKSFDMKTWLLALGLFGLAFYGPISGAWYGALDQYVLPDAPNSAAAVAAKTTLDQILWAPILVTCLFAWDLSFSNDNSNDDELGAAGPGGLLLSKLRSDLLPTLLVNWSFWQGVPSRHVPSRHIHSFVRHIRSFVCLFVRYASHVFHSTRRTV